MKTKQHHHLMLLIRRAGSLLLAAALSLGSSAMVPAQQAVLAAPASRTAAAPLAAPAPGWVSCGAGCDLYAQTGNYSLYTGAGNTLPVSVPVWSFTAGAADPVQLPGPTLWVNDSDSFSITLHNVDIPVSISLSIPASAQEADTVGIAAGAPQKAYAFSNLAPGTYLYEAGIVDGGNTDRAVAMGLYGALVVYPAANPGMAYGPGTGFTEEALLVFSEIDPDFNANPLGANAFALQEFKARYYLINGQPYPNTAHINVTNTSTLLLRMVNAGVDEATIGALGLRQTVIAADAAPLAYPYRAATPSVFAGQAVDSLVTIPGTALSGAAYPLYNGSLRLRNNTAAGLGGMATLIEVTTGGTAVQVGPVTDAITVTPTGTQFQPYGVSAQISDVNQPALPVDQAEFHLDSAANPAQALALNGGSWTTSLGALSGGAHTVYVRGHNSAGWGAFSSQVFYVDQVGPTTIALNVVPGITNGGSVGLYGTADDTQTGRSFIQNAEYTLDGSAAATALSLAPAYDPLNGAPLVAISGAIPVPAVQGVHTLHVRARDALNNWGVPSDVSFMVDKTAPAVSLPISLSPGTVDFTGGTPLIPNNAVRVTITATDPDVLVGADHIRSNVVNMEAFIDNVPAPARFGLDGYLFTVSDGSFNSPSEAGFLDIPLATVNVLTGGTHKVFVHARDAAGNWGPLDSSSPAYATLTVVKPAVSPVPGPIMTGLAVSPNPTGANAVVTIQATATSQGFILAVMGAGYTIRPGANPAAPAGNPDNNAGNGGNPTGWFPMTTADGFAFGLRTQRDVHVQNVSVISLTPGVYTVFIMAKDSAGTWGPAEKATFQVGNAQVYLPLVKR